MFESIRQAVGLVGKQRRGRWLLLVALALVTSAFELVGAVLVYSLLALVADPGGEIDLPLIGDLRQLFSGVDEQMLLLALAASMAIFFAIQAVVKVGQIYVQNRVAHNLGAQISTRLARGYL